MKTPDNEPAGAQLWCTQDPDSVGEDRPFFLPIDNFLLWSGSCLRQECASAPTTVSAQTACQTHSSASEDPKKVGLVGTLWELLLSPEIP